MVKVCGTPTGDIYIFLNNINWKVQIRQAQDTVLPFGKSMPTYVLVKMRKGRTQSSDENMAYKEYAEVIKTLCDTNMWVFVHPNSYRNIPKVHEYEKECGFKKMAQGYIYNPCINNMGSFI